MTAAWEQERLARLWPATRDPFRRYLEAAPFDAPPWRKRRGPNGRGLCRWCGVEVPRGRQTWCGQECIDAYMLRKSGPDLRRRVEVRDEGRCASCGLDTVRYRRILTHLRYHGPKALRGHWVARWQALRARFGEPAWQADHIVPVVEGGGQCGLENLRTLCDRCHTAETSALAGRRARDRRTARQPELPGVG